jgi:shikimate kinase
MGSGKTSIGEVLADRLGRPLVDGDAELEERTGGRTAADVTAEQGLAVLHELEEDIALAALARRTRAVIGPAASVCDSAAVRQALAEHLVVWLGAPAEHLAEEAVRKSHRPLVHEGDPVALFQQQIAAREPLVAPLAALVLDVSTTSDEDAVTAIVDLVRTHERAR